MSFPTLSRKAFKIISGFGMRTHPLEVMKFLIEDTQIVRQIACAGKPHVETCLARVHVPLSKTRFPTFVRDTIIIQASETETLGTVIRQICGWKGCKPSQEAKHGV